MPPHVPLGSNDDLWILLVVGAMPLLGLASLGRWSDVQLGLGIVLVALAMVGLFRRPR